MQQRFWPDPQPLVERLGREFFRNVPKRPGVYLMRDASEVVLYVGKAKNLRQRLTNYRVANPERLARRHLRMLRQVHRIELQECPDEITALAREAELLLALKPKFNRAGVWRAPPRFLIWRWDGRTLALAIAETPIVGWQLLGRFGSGAVYLRAALLRLLWYVLNPTTGSTTMPAGWMHGRLGTVAAIAIEQTVEPSNRGLELVLAMLIDGHPDRFVTWVGEQTKSLVKAYDVEMRDADLETVIEFMRTRARCTLSVSSSAQNANAKRGGREPMLPFSDEDWQHW